MRTLKDKSIKIVLDTQELDGDQAGLLYSFNGKFLKVLLTDAGIYQQSIEAVESVQIEEDNGKSPSVRLRNVLYRLWEKKSDGYNIFEDFYRAKIETIVTHFKGKLD
jgi:hypothetical protein